MSAECTRESQESAVNPLEFLAALREVDGSLVQTCTNGGCFKLYLLLKAVWPQAEPWYDSDHVITKINGQFYDIRGEVVPDKHLPMREEPRIFNEAYFWRKT